MPGYGHTIQVSGDKGKHVTFTVSGRVALDNLESFISETQDRLREMIPDYAYHRITWWLKLKSLSPMPRSHPFAGGLISKHEEIQNKIQSGKSVRYCYLCAV